MTLEELRAVRAGGPGFCGPDTFNELTRLAEERLLLEQMADGESQALLVGPYQPEAVWEIDTGTHLEDEFTASTLGAAIRKAAGVSARRRRRMANR